jgi:hypothetical protein
MGGATRVGTAGDKLYPILCQPNYRLANSAPLRFLPEQRVLSQTGCCELYPTGWTIWHSELTVPIGRLMGDYLDGADTFVD